MVAYILDGFAVAEKEMDSIAQEIRSHSHIRPPKIVVILVGDDPASSIYVQYKMKACARVGMESVVFRLEERISQEDLKKVITQCNDNSEIDAILLQLPLPKHLSLQSALNAIDPKKDVDCLHPFNMGLLVHSNPYVMPCTPSGILTLLDHYKITLESVNVTVIGRSLIVGKSFALLATQRNATVTVCHSYTNNIKEHTRKADIVVVAIGKARFLTEDMVKDGAVIIDVGINREGKTLVGDTDFKALFPKVKAITPVPKGIGPMTIVQLLHNTLTLWKKQLYL